MRLTGGDWAASRRVRVAACLAVFLGAAAGASRVEAEPAETQVTVLALGGHDPVSYFLPDGPQPGSPRFETVWSGRAWRFAAEANRAAFLRDPEVYAPRLGGYDPAGVLERRLVEASPAMFAIIADRLYLFRNGERRDRFLAQPGLAAAAEAIWPELRVLLDDPPPLRASPAGSPAVKPPEAPAEPVTGKPGAAGRRSLSAE